MVLTFQRMDGNMLHPNGSSQINNGETSALTSLKPMGFSDILDTTFSIYRKRFRLFLGISAVYLFSHIAFSTNTHEVIFYCELFVLVLCCGAFTFVSAEAYIGRHIAVRDAFRHLKHRFWRFVGSSLLYWLVIVLLSVTVIGVPFAIFFWTRWGLYAQAVMVEETSARDALKRSGELVKGAWWRVFGIMMGIFLIYIVIDYILITSSTLIFALSGVSSEVNFFEIIRRMIWEPHSEIEGILHLLHVIHTAIDALLIPITAMGYTVLYFDRRVRKEGFDIEMMLAEEEV